MVDSSRIEGVNKRVKERLGDEYEVYDPAADFDAERVPASDGGGVAKAGKTIGTKIYKRFFGTDVEDPIPMSRLGTQLVGGLGGAYAGAELGGVAGTAIGGPGLGTGIGALVGGAVGGFGGSMAGTVLPEALMDQAEFLGIADPGTRQRIGLSNEELKTVVEGEALLDMVTGGGIIAARALTRGTIKVATGIGKQGRKLADWAAEKGINMLPVQVGDRVIPRGFVAVMGKFPLIASPIRRRVIQSDQAFKEAFQNLPANIAPLATMSDVSRRVLFDAKNLFTKVSDEYATQYKDVFKRAGDAGVTVTPKTTVNKLREIAKGLEKEAPKSASGKTITGPGHELDRFLSNEIAPIFKTTKSGAQTVAPQSLEAMDGLLTKIDRQIGKFAEEGGHRQDIARLMDVKNGMQLDMYTKLEGPGSAGVGRDLQHLDQKFSLDMENLFETVASNKFKQVKQGGLKGLNFEEATRTDPGQLADILMRGNSIKILEDTHKLVQPETFKELAAARLDSLIEGAVTVDSNSLRSINIEKLYKDLGFNNVKGDRYLHTKKMLELSGGMSMDELDKMLQVGRKISEVEAPNASTFVARRATMGGIHAVVGSVLPVAAVSGGAAAGHGGIALLASGFVLGGSRFIGHMITDPLAARSLAKVLKPETLKAAKKAAWLRAGQITVQGMMKVGAIGEDEAQNLWDWIKGSADQIDKETPADYEGRKAPPSEE